MSPFEARDDDLPRLVRRLASYEPRSNEADSRWGVLLAAFKRGIYL